MPLTDSDTPSRVEGCKPTVIEVQETMRYRHRCSIDLEIAVRSVDGLVAVGRARRKIENEHDHVLENPGQPRKIIGGAAKSIWPARW